MVTGIAACTSTRLHAPLTSKCPEARSASPQAAVPAAVTPSHRAGPQLKQVRAPRLAQQQYVSRAVRPPTSTVVGRTIKHAFRKPGSPLDPGADATRSALICTPFSAEVFGRPSSGTAGVDSYQPAVLDSVDDIHSEPLFSPTVVAHGIAQPSERRPSSPSSACHCPVLSDRVTTVSVVSPKVRCTSWNTLSVLSMLP